MRRTLSHGPLARRAINASRGLVFPAMVTALCTLGLGPASPNQRSSPPATVSQPDPIIDNGSLVQLGINPEGHSNVPGGTTSSGFDGTTDVGVRFIPTNGEATTPGCLCEGWGVANADAATGLFAGYANVSADGVVNLTVEAGTGVYAGPAGEIQLLPESNGTRLRSVVRSSSGHPRQ